MIIALGPSNVIVGGGNGTVIGPTYHVENTTESSIRVLHIYASYNFTDETMFVKNVVKWLTVPFDRHSDILSIHHAEAFQYISTIDVWNNTTHVYDQTVDFYAKQIYQWTEYNSDNYPDVYGESTREVIYYDENDTDLYKPEFDNGIIFRPELKKDEYDFIQTGWNNEFPVGYLEGYKVTYLELSIEADFDLLITSITSGVFNAGMRHQELSANFTWDDVYLTPAPPFISLSMGLLGMNLKYDDGLGVSVVVPMTD